MQGDLISRSALIETIEQDIKMTERFMEKLANLYKVNSKEYACLNAQLNTLKSFKGIVEQKPTAYSVEDVVEEMNKLLTEELNSVLKPLPDGSEYTEEAYRLLYLNTRISDAIRNGGKE